MGGLEVANFECASDFRSDSGRTFKTVASPNMFFRKCSWLRAACNSPLPRSRACRKQSHLGLQLSPGGRRPPLNR
eukprot:3969757-Alexandrium_andersonii.AAC.1